MDIRNIISLVYSKLKSLINFYINALKDIDKEYNLVLEHIIFSPKYQQKVPVIRLIGSSGYLIETADNILKYDKYKCHLHPDDLLKINELNSELKSQNQNKLIQEDISGEIYLDNGDIVNIYKPNLDELDLNKLFSLPQVDIARLLESRGFKKGRKISTEIAELKTSLSIQSRNKLRLIK